MERFKASTQYGDWEGTAAADNQPTSLHDFLEEKGLIEEHEFLLAATLYVGEHSYDSPYVKAYLFKGDDYESVKKKLDANKGPIPVREVDIKLTTEEFLELFKRFDVMLTWHGLNLQGREFVTTE